MRNDETSQPIPFLIPHSPLPSYPVCSTSSAFQKGEGQATIRAAVYARRQSPNPLPITEVLNCRTTPAWN